jgi:hypothetical protein
MKAYFGVEVQLHAFFNLGTRKRLSGQWIGGWVGPRAGLNAVVKRKIPSPRRESNPRTSIVQPISQRYTD